MKVIKKGKKKRKPKKSSKRWEKYTDGKVTHPVCPRCGPGIFLAKSKSGDRIYCGKCHYTEFLKKEKPVESEDKKESGEKPKK